MRLYSDQSFDDQVVDFGEERVCVDANCSVVLAESCKGPLATFPLILHRKYRGRAIVR